MSESQPRQLPERPSLDFYKHEAKSLLKAGCAGEVDAKQRLSSDGGAAQACYALHDAQRAIAREHGFKNWTEFKERILAAQPAAHGLTLRVVDRNDETPLPGATVLVEGPGFKSSHLTDAQGSVLLPLPSPLPYYFSVRVRQEGRVPRLISWNLAQPDFRLPETFTLETERARPIGGIVRNQEGEPVEGAKVVLIIRPSSGGGIAVQIFDDIWEREAVTDREGKWRFAEAPSTLRHLSVALDHPDYLREQVHPLPSISHFYRQNAPLTLKRGRSYEGTVVDAQGRPLSGVEVVYGEAAASSTTFPTAITDAQGGFRFPALPVSDGSGHFLTFTAKDHAPELLELAEARNPLAIVLPAGHPLRIRLRDGLGEPIVDARLVPENWRGHRSLRLDWRSDADGEFHWQHAPEEAIRYFVLHPEFQVLTVDLQPQAAPIELRLLKRTTVEGRVLDARTSLPLPAFTVVPGRYFPEWHPLWSGWHLRGALPGVEGHYRYRFESPAVMGSHDGGAETPGFHRLRIEAEGYAPAVSRPIANEEEGLALDFHLEPSPDIQGKVLSPQGNPVSGAQLIVAGPGNPLVIRNGEFTEIRDQWVRETGADGGYRLPPQEENFPVVAVHPDAGYCVTSVEAVKAHPELRLLPWGTLRLKTSNPAGVQSPFYLGSSRKELRPAEQPRVRFESSPQVGEGRIVFDHLQAGPLRIGSFYQSVDEGPVVEIIGGGEIEVDMAKGGGSVIGRITFPLGAVPPRRLQAPCTLAPQVPDPSPPGLERAEKMHWFREWLKTPEGSVYRAQSRPFSFQLLEDGSFRVDNVPPGPYLLTAVFPSRAGSAGAGMEAHVARREVVLEPGQACLDLGVLEALPVTLRTMAPP